MDYLHTTGENLPAGLDLDWVLSIGVLHHIPDPDPVVRAAYAALRPGGKLLVWLCGWEGNELYLAVTTPVRKVTTRLPHWALTAASKALVPPLTAYATLCKWLPLPMASYMREHIVRLAPEVRMLTIYDQLNPAHARYYREREVRELLSRAGFRDVKLHHRHGYSWTVVGTK